MSNLELALASLFVSGKITEQELRRLYKLIKKERHNMLSLFDLFKSKSFKRGYFVHSDNGKNVLCKILNEYDTREEATKDLVNLVTNKITEKDLYKEFLKRQSW